MSNPFEVTGNLYCASCEVKIPKEELAYARDGEFICEECADADNNICGCGNFKKSEYETCYECYEN